MKVHGFELHDDVWNNLRNCQKLAIDASTKYFKKPFEGKSCLVSLPTGAGKTGVICVVSNIKKFDRVLVLSHRRAVVKQIVKQLKGEFYKKIVPDSEIETKATHSDLKNINRRGVFVSTFQKLEKMPSVELNDFQKSIDLLIVDEGHAEPSPVWSDIARGFDCYKIIITATPYRNDLFSFDVDPNQGVIYTFKKALKEEVLEEPSFRSIDSNGLVTEIKEWFVKHPLSKCIVKCNKFEDVDDYRELLNGEFLTLAIHDRYSKDTRDHVKENVPANIEKSDYQVIIHQRKLDEGIDIPSAKLLVLTYPVSSGRELVQTVGRIVRTFENIPASVIELDSNANQQLWDNYREFDEYLYSAGNAKTFLDSLNAANLIKSYLDAFPTFSYFNHGFQKKFDLVGLNIEKSISIPLASVCFVQKGINFSIDAFMDRLRLEGTRDGELCDLRVSEDGFRVIVSITFNNSRFLKDSMFFEPKLEVMIVKDLGDSIAIFDSRSRDFSGKQKDYKTGYAIAVDDLLKLVSRSKITKTKEVHARNISTSNKRPEAIAIKGNNLDAITGTQSNSSQAITTLKVDNWETLDKKHSSYYLGVGSGRVSDQKNRNFTLSKLNEWITDISDALASSGIANSSLISSYAKPINHEPDQDPVAIILDFSIYDCEVIFTKIDGIQGRVSNSFCYRTYTTFAELIDSSSDFPITLNYSKDEKSYFIEGNWVAEAHCIVNGETVSAQKVLNEINLKLLFEDGTSFVNDQFYRVQLPSSAGFDIDSIEIGRLLVSINSLSHSGMTEKDELNTGQDSFGSNSIFSELDKLKSVSVSSAQRSEFGEFYNYIPDIDLILCTDMGTEPADFILSSPTKLVFVHVKCGGTTSPQSSAGAIAEVGGQGIKNMEHLISSSSGLRPGNFRSYTNKWKTNKTGALALQERLRLFHGKRFSNPTEDGAMRAQAIEQAWSLLIERRKSPIVEKCIWLVVGNAFSRSHFKTQLGRGDSAVSESKQAYQLINSWASTCSELDVDLKLFVSN